MDIQPEISYFKAQLKQHADPKRAQGAQAYLKSPFKFYGVDTATKRRFVKAWLKDHPEVSIDQIAELAAKLWASNWHEEKTLAVMLLNQTSSQLTLKQMSLIERMINESTGWDHLDSIAVHLVGALINHDPKTIKYLPKWAKSKNFWVRRAALLSQILQFRRKKGNHRLFFRLAIPEFDEGKNWSKEERFFIRKAIGWTLREIAQAKPEVTFRFLKKYKGKMAGLTFREGSRKLPDDLRSKLV